MKKYSVLVRRALVFTAIVLILAVAVGLPAFLAAGNFLDTRATRTELAACQALIREAPLAERTWLPVPAGGEVWLANREGVRSFVNPQAEIPKSVSAEITAALLGNESISRVQLNGRACLLSAFSVEDAAVAIAAPISGGSRMLAALIGAFSGLLGAFLGAWALKRPLLVRAVKPIMQLRDVAVAVAGGELSARCDESAPGEFGELGRAINNLSSQLARNLYTLILERNRLRQMIDGLSEGVIAVDSEGAVTHANPALEKLFARGKPGVHLPDARMRVIPDSSVWADFDSVVASGEAVTRNLTVQDRTLRLTVSPIIDEIGMTAGAVGLVSDITQSERLERTRREYVSNVSHELRTPLTAVRALVEPLKEGMVTNEADRMRYYDIILREVLRLSRLINDQLELSRLQSGTIAIEKKRMALDDLVYDVCERYQTIAEEQGLALEIPTDFSACPPVYANADRIEELLIILLDNAIKYTEKGAVRVSAEWDDTVVRLSVSDTGIGISEEDLPYVFDRFYKVDKAHSGKGSGLGLSIAQELIARMDEEISVSSEKNQGTTFTFTIHIYQKPAE